MVGGGRSCSRGEGWRPGMETGVYRAGSSGTQGCVRVFSAWEPCDSQRGPRRTPSVAYVPSHNMCPRGHQLGQCPSLTHWRFPGGDLGLIEEDAEFPETSQRCGRCGHLCLSPKLPLDTISLHFRRFCWVQVLGDALWPAE